MLSTYENQTDTLSLPVCCKLWEMCEIPNKA